MEKAKPRPSVGQVLALFLLFVVSVLADCTCTGLDYTNGGSYLVDGTNTADFTFTSVFQSCGPDTVEPILLDPTGVGYLCTEISMEASGEQQQSSCEIPYSRMISGKWSIIIQADATDFQVIREFTLTVQALEKATVTATPTVVVGVTSTLPAVVVETTLYQTSTYLGKAPVVSVQCGYDRDTTFTLTQWLAPPRTTVWTTVERTRTEGSVTSVYVTTVGLSAYCHWPQGQGARPPTVDRPAPAPSTPKPSGCGDWGMGMGMVVAMAAGMVVAGREAAAVVEEGLGMVKVEVVAAAVVVPVMGREEVEVEEEVVLAMGREEVEVEVVVVLATGRAVEEVGEEDLEMEKGAAAEAEAEAVQVTEREVVVVAAAAALAMAMARAEAEEEEAVVGRVEVEVVGRAVVGEAEEGRMAAAVEEMGVEKGEVVEEVRVVEAAGEAGNLGEVEVVAVRAEAVVAVEAVEVVEVVEEEAEAEAAAEGVVVVQGEEVEEAVAVVGATEEGVVEVAVAVVEIEAVEVGEIGVVVEVGEEVVEGEVVVAAAAAAAVVEAENPSNDAPIEERGIVRVAAITTTILQTTYTVTQTTTKIVPARTAIETVYDVVTRTFIPPAQTVCNEPDIPTITVFRAEPTQTIYNVQYVTLRTQVTVWVGQTQYETYSNYQSATACWANGGYYGV
ncbi:hypothetical protein OQA88_4427 [Cercophora sp. LCS_1]